MTTLARVLIGICIICTAGYAEAKILIFEQTVTSPELWQYVSSDPVANSTLDKLPAKITVTFSQAVKAEGSFIKLYDSYGNLMNTEPLVTNNTSMSETLPASVTAYNGTYHVEWQATCQCKESKVLEDNFYFTVQH